ncbi:hypothetical protein GH868_29625, partial [Bacillus thuringiensis]|nr:hypothetical protein [Bacillus thuringiensis]
PQGATGELGEEGKTGKQGEQGATGVAGFNGSVGATGERGQMGLNGSKGDDGKVGATGPVGPRGLPGVVVTVESPESAHLKTEDAGLFSFFSNPIYVMALFVWIAVITIVVVVVIVVVAVTRRRRQTPPETIYVDRKLQPLIADDEDLPSWVGSMKEETETNYSNNTLKADGTENDAQRPTSFDYTNEIGG